MSSDEMSLKGEKRRVVTRRALDVNMDVGMVRLLESGDGADNIVDNPKSC